MADHSSKRADCTYTNRPTIISLMLVGGLKICLVVPFRGASRYVVGLANYLSKKGVEVQLVCLAAIDFERYGELSSTVKVRKIWSRAPSHNSKLVAIMETLFGLISTVILHKMHAKERFDIIFFSGAPVSSFFYLTSFGFRRGCVAIEDGGPLPEFISPKVFGLLSSALRKIVFTHCNGVIFAGGPSFGRAMVHRYGLDGRQVLIAPEGVDTEFFRPSSKPSPRTRPSERFVLCVGAITPRKNQLSILKAAQESTYARNVGFIFIGPIIDRNYYSSLLAIVRRNKQLSVRFLSNLSQYELLGYYQSCELTMLLSTNEGMARAILEPMSCGKPVIASDIPENRDCAVEGNEILFVGPFDIARIGQSMDALLSNQVASRDMGERARRTALTYFDSSKMFALRLAFFKKLLANRESPMSGSARVSSRACSSD
ncbi:MAG: glycosyltransferase family 4 protein [Candidatus Parvarchaeota archaeon]